MAHVISSKMIKINTRHYNTRHAVHVMIILCKLLWPTLQINGWCLNGVKWGKCLPEGDLRHSALDSIVKGMSERDCLTGLIYRRYLSLIHS